MFVITWVAEILSLGKCSKMPMNYTHNIYTYTQTLCFIIVYIEQYTTGEIMPNFTRFSYSICNICNNGVMDRKYYHYFL